MRQSPVAYGHMGLISPQRQPLGHARFTAHLDTPYPSILLLAQSETELILIERLSAWISRSNAASHSPSSGKVSAGSSRPRPTRTIRRNSGGNLACRLRRRAQCRPPRPRASHSQGPRSRMITGLADLHIQLAARFNDEIHAFLGKQGLPCSPSRSPTAGKPVSADRAVAGETTAHRWRDPTLADMRR